MYKKIALFSGIFTVGLLSFALSAKAVNVTVGSGSNLVSVYSCEQVGRNVRVKTSASASAYVLNSSCRDAGHGMRNYSLTCTSATQYRVQWTDCSNRPTDDQAPSLSVSASELTNTVTDGRYSYQVTVNAEDTANNIRGIKITVREENNNAVQTWWVDGRNGQSSSEEGFGTRSVSRTITKTGLQIGKNYIVTATVYDVRGNSRTATASGTLFVPSTSDTTGPSVTASVTYTVVASGNTQKVVPTLSARATDTNKVTKIVLYHSTDGRYTAIKTCNPNTTTGSCSFTFRAPSNGNFYAIAWDEAGNQTTSTVYSF